MGGGGGGSGSWVAQREPRSLITKKGLTGEDGQEKRGVFSIYCSFKCACVCVCG